MFYEFAVSEGDHSKLETQFPSIIKCPFNNKIPSSTCSNSSYQAIYHGTHGTVNVVGRYRKMKLKGGAIRGRNIIVFY